VGAGKIVGLFQFVLLVLRGKSLSLLAREVLFGGKNKRARTEKDKKNGKGGWETQNLTVLRGAARLGAEGFPFGKRKAGSTGDSHLIDE